MTKDKKTPKEQIKREYSEEEIDEIRRLKEKIIKSFNELKRSIERYTRYYNEERIKAKLGYLSPIKYRKLNAV